MCVYNCISAMWFKTILQCACSWRQCNTQYTCHIIPHALHLINMAPPRILFPRIPVDVGADANVAMPGPAVGAHVPGGDGIGDRRRCESRCEGRRRGLAHGGRGTPAEEARRRSRHRRLRGGWTVGERAPEEGGGGHDGRRWAVKEEKMRSAALWFLRFCGLRFCVAWRMADEGKTRTNTYMESGEEERKM